MSDWLLIEGDPTTTECAACGHTPSILFLIPKGIYFVKCLNCSSKSPLRKTRGCVVNHWNNKQKAIREAVEGSKVYDGVGRVR